MLIWSVFFGRRGRRLLTFIILGAFEALESSLLALDCVPEGFPALWLTSTAECLRLFLGSLQE